MQEKKDKKSICPLCEINTVQKFIRTYFDKEFNVEYFLFECENCGVQHWSPLKNPGGEWYERDERYANRNIDPTVVPGFQHILTTIFLNKYFNKNRINKNILDVGCGNGNFLAYAKKFGFTGVGFDFDRDGIESGKRTFGLTDLYVDNLENYKKNNPEKKYELITFFDVFEHIDNHNEFINDVKSLLKDGGVTALSIPHRDSAKWLIPGDVPPRHLTRWEPKSIRKFYEDRGFEILKIGMIQATWKFIVMKLRWKYGKLFNFNLVGKIKKKESVETYKNEQGNISYIPKNSWKVRLVHFLAKAKDYIIFGIPASFIYLLLLGAKERYTDMYIVAKKIK